jgi:hypothetical protein
MNFSKSVSVQFSIPFRLDSWHTSLFQLLSGICGSMRMRTDTFMGAMGNSGSPSTPECKTMRNLYV